MGARYIRVEEINKYSHTSNWVKSPGVYFKLSGIISISNNFILKPGLAYVYQNVESRHSYAINGDFITETDFVFRKEFTFDISIEYEIKSNLYCGGRVSMPSIRNELPIAIGGLLGYRF